MYYQYFTVTGSGGFPIDMLRYDSCYPATQDDSAKIGDSLRARISDESPPWNRNKVRILIGRYVRYKSDVPTTRRWNSFGWSVTEPVTRKL